MSERRSRTTARIRTMMNQFDAVASDLEVFRAKVEGLIAELLEAHGIEIHTIESRVKRRESFERKVRGASKYKSMEAVTDVVGIRIITLFSDGVDAVAAMVESEFEVDYANSLDKRTALEPDRFGYISLHYVAQLPAARVALTEMARFSGRKFEIQVRSVLQHAWAEIEHDLGYKSQEAVPKQIRRRFSRLAGLLELADDEFCAMKEELAQYSRTLTVDVEERPAEVLLDRDSLLALLASAEVVRLDEEIADESGNPLSELPSETYTSGLVRQLVSANFSHIGEVEDYLASNRGLIRTFAVEFLFNMGLRILGESDDPDYDLEDADELGVERGISLYYTALIKTLKSGDPDQVVALWRAHSSTDDDEEMLDESRRDAERAVRALNALEAQISGS